MTFVWADGTIYDPALRGYRPATVEEVAYDRVEQLALARAEEIGRRACAGALAFWLAVAKIRRGWVR
jgi:hypothetical protein